MFGLNSLDVALGLIFVYLLLSLVCSAATEIFTHWVNLRADVLRRGIRGILTGYDDGSIWERIRTLGDGSVRARLRSRGFRGVLAWLFPTAPEDRAKVGVALLKARADLEEARAAVNVEFPDELDAYDRARKGVEELRQQFAGARRVERASIANVKQAERGVAAAAGGGDASALTAAHAVAGDAETAKAAAGDDVRAASTKLRAAQEAIQSTRAALANAVATKGGVNLVAAMLAAQDKVEQAEGGLLVSRLYAHPLITAMSQRRRTRLGLGSLRIPSYIPAKAFSGALLDLVLPDGTGSPAAMSDLRDAVAKLPRQIARPLSLFVNEAGEDIEKARLELERWYEDSMERVSGLYKRYTQLIVLTLACLIALVLNADSLRIGRALASDAALRSSVVAYAEAVAQHPPEAVQALLAVDSTGADVAAPQTPAADDLERARAHLRSIREMVDSVETLGIPLGWSENSTAAAPVAWEGVKADAQDIGGQFYRWPVWLIWSFVRLLWAAVVTLFTHPGLVVTALAVSLGAPFWFDMLNKIVNVRSSGRAPEEKPKSPEALPPARGA